MSHQPALLLLAVVAIALGLASLAGCDTDRVPLPPNVVFILTDDHRHDALGCAGHPWIRTPNLDRLADEGIRFTSAFVTTSLCSPSRASFLTGLYAHRHGVTRNEHADLSRSLPTIAQLLQNAGYETAFIGKWHMARWSTPRQGFDHWVSFNRQGDYLKNTLNVDGRWVLSERYVTDELTDRALAFLDHERDRPFLLILSHKAVHAPFLPAPRDTGLYTDATIAPVTTPPGGTAGKPDWGSRRPDFDQVSFQREYARTLAAVDTSVGRILDRLDELGLLDETVVLYAGDNGFLSGEHGGLVDKRAAYEPSIRIPLLMRYPPRVPRGRVCEELVLNIDLAPTVVELAGLAVPAGMQGASWLPLLAGAPGRHAILYEYFAEEGPVPTTLAVRTRDWKLITFPLDPGLPEELYDLQADPDEHRNLAADPAHAKTLANLRAELVSLQEETDFTMIHH